MIKKAIHTTFALLFLSAALVSCRNDFGAETPDAPDGCVALRFRADIPAMQEVNTRAVDEDGAGVQTMTLFCFDAYGLFVTTATAKVETAAEGTSGTFEAAVPDHTRTVHFVANQNMSEFPEESFFNKSEAEVMALLQGSSGRMIYWARFACDKNSDEKIDAQMSAAGNAIRLIRNHALVELATPTTQWFEATGFKVCNTNAFGTVAPYHPEKGFDFTWPEADDPFVTLPRDGAKMSDIRDVTTDMSQYVFECQNSADDPVSVIIRGHLPGEDQTQDLYYRVMLIDHLTGEQLLVRRNHRYKVNITGPLAYGQPSFEEALESAATNNVWIAISEEVTEVEDRNYVLAVDRTAYVLDESSVGTDRTYRIGYTLKGKGTQTVTAADKPEVSWLEGNTVASSKIDNQFTVTDGVGRGTITVTTFPIGDDMQKLEGTLLVKKDRLQRKIKVITVKKQTFVPSWMGAQLYGKLDAENTIRPHATAVFTIPETCPRELFPMRVLLSANDLDLRASSGMKLAIVRKGEEGYGEDSNEWNYKYVYIAEKPGVQRVYFESILSQGNMDARKLIIEAEHFETMTLSFHFSEKLNTITLAGLSEYNASEGDEGPKDEAILYRLVPQKKGATVRFDMQMLELNQVNYSEGNAINATEHDEFLIYTSNLRHYDDGEEAKAGVAQFDCVFHHTEASAWSQANNPNGGQACMFTPKNPAKPAGETGKYTIHMYTTKAQSSEVVRIASNLPSYPAVLAENADADGSYMGETYRSVIFELANYNPFRFAARVNYDRTGAQGSDASGADEETATPLEWSYSPGLPVDIEFDVTSFRGLRSATDTEGESVDPFGEEFEIYVDAPMLEIDASRLTECGLDAEKLKAHPSIPGRFVYTVAAERNAERAYGCPGLAVVNKDGTGADQTGERKRLPFKVNGPVSAGDITISSDESRVVFFAKTFRVTNRSIGGRLQYRSTDGSLADVPRHSFVPFELTKNNSRIGAVTVVADGRYELRLRKEYLFNWYADRIQLRFQSAAGTTYGAEIANLASLFNNPDIVLAPLADN